MLNRNKDGFELSCDSCSETEQIETSDFKEVVSFIKEMKWKIFRVYGQWEHLCPVCIEEAKQKEYSDLARERGAI